jgi:hypothetical protein
MILKRKAPMVGWFQPRQLAHTAYQVFLSTVFGRHADRRLLEVGSPGPDPLVDKSFNFANAEGPFWFDYVADVGDGFDSTYTIARTIAAKELEVATPEGESFHTKRGSILIFGGDEVYPTASPENYRERLVLPYNAAFPRRRKGEGTSKEQDPRPSVFAIPGNHDWYDSLVSFSDLFCENDDFAGWKTVQKRSYFALRLPRGWWLFGTDTQLGSSLDKPQIEYFGGVMKKVLPTEKIILCNAEPYWINAGLSKDATSFSDQQMRYFTASVLRNQVAVYIAGDRHYYRRHEEAGTSGTSDHPPSKKQKITAGGGGAFLHPTHNEDLDRIGKSRVYELKKSFPEPSVSRRLGYWNLLFPLWNPGFGSVTAVLYLLTARAFLSNIGTYKWNEIHLALRTVAHDTLTEPFSLYWVLLCFIGFLFFTDTSSKVYRWIAGTIHAAAHLAATFVIAWQVSYFLSGGRGLDFASVTQLLTASALIFAGGWVIGSMIMGLYLFVSLNVFGRHHNDAFSAIKIADYKNFLRLTIEENGDLVIYPIGIKKVIKRWKKGDRTRGESEFVPQSIKEENVPFLIEPPIRFMPSALVPAVREARPPSGPGPESIEKKVVEVNVN